MNLYKVKSIRNIVLPLLKYFDRDIKIKHPWIKNKAYINLSLFKHKGYWFHGQNREKETMLLFQKIISIGNVVAEVGGHIGYLTLWFQQLIGSEGKLIVFEPGTNNLPYIENNINGYKNISLIKRAIGSKTGVLKFYEDNLTGQNNSLVKDFDGFKNNAKWSNTKSVITTKEVAVTTLDIEFKNRILDFIKIDIEGAEWQALQGAKEVINRCKPAMMIEIQADKDAIFDYLDGNNYVLFNDSKKNINVASDLKGNIFCLHRECHSILINSLFNN